MRKHGEYTELVDAAREFCRKVNAGEARSVRSYRAFTKALESLDKQNLIAELIKTAEEFLKQVEAREVKSTRAFSFRAFKAALESITKQEHGN